MLILALSPLGWISESTALTRTFYCCATLFMNYSNFRVIFALAWSLILKYWSNKRQEHRFFHFPSVCLELWVRAASSSGDPPDNLWGWDGVNQELGIQRLTCMCSRQALVLLLINYHYWPTPRECGNTKIRALGLFKLQAKFGLDLSCWPLSGDSAKGVKNSVSSLMNQILWHSDLHLKRTEHRGNIRTMW